MNILGISAFYHDSAACLVQDGKIIAAAQEERFTRKKHDPSFPNSAIKYCLQEGGLDIDDVDYIAFYDKPFLTFERLLETYLSFAPKGLKSYLQAVPVWLKQKLWVPAVISKETGYKGKILFTEHHQAHAASAFYPSPFDRSAWLTVDAVGEWATTSYGIASSKNLTVSAEIHFPHSLGMLYSAFTYYTGFKVNSGEYKVMGLAPYGKPKYVDLIYKHLITVKEDGSFKLNMNYFNFAVGLTMTNERFHNLFGGPPRQPESELTQKEMDLAASVQKVTEDIMLKLARHVKAETGESNLCLAGGVALNCVANGKILREGIFENIWIQPAAGDAGGALGAALATWYQYLDNNKDSIGGRYIQEGSLFGPEFSNEDIKLFLDTNKINYTKIEDFDSLCEQVAEYLDCENVIGWFQGRMEFGPRALGNRSIIGDPRSPDMQKKMNLKIKYRESFRPFAPSVLSEYASEYFEINEPSPYMLLTAYVKPSIRRQLSDDEEKLWGVDKLNTVRSSVPAITHIDYSARLQTVHKEYNQRYYQMIDIFRKRTGCPMVVNTSFNVRGEPIVCTPKDAYICFMRTEMDYLVLGDFILDKKDQPELKNDKDWQKEYELD